MDEDWPVFVFVLIHIIYIYILYIYEKTNVIRICHVRELTSEWTCPGCCTKLDHELSHTCVSVFWFRMNDQASAQIWRVSVSLLFNAIV
jgi:hypothetical protein